MSRLHVFLQDGFHHDSVRVSVVGKEVYRSADVHTARHTGLADKFDVDVQDGDVTLDVLLEKRAVPNQIVSLRVTEESWVAITLDEQGRLVHTMSLTPFG